MSGMRWIWVTVLAAGFVASPVRADDGEQEALARLKRFGGVSGGSAKRLLTDVEKRMKKSADNFTPPNDPLRVAVSRSLFNADTPPNAMQGAKVRLRLFAGANAWALETFFRPVPGQIQNCQRNFSLDAEECEALVAAAGQVSVADARKLGAGAATNVARGAGAGSPFGGSGPAAQPTQRRAQLGQGNQIAAPPAGNRFARYDSGFRANSARPSAPVAARRPVMAPRPAMNTAQQTSTKEAYKARREAYLARQRARMEEKKQAQAKAAEPKEEPAEEAKAEDVDPLEAAEAPEVTKKDNPQLSDDFLNDLMADPLGK